MSIDLGYDLFFIAEAGHAELQCIVSPQAHGIDFVLILPRYGNLLIRIG